ncbi:hypothetical protein [Actinacidiphila oryziradicis]|uniref:Uncharacterized protein n=1 Tax=Actinacidiphila oryziradicis TaxID=2571141 RepID=A0A4U0RTY4_9ACTN|nr:hypothetical protein [Actinacidiphila oryziradicis]TJZ99633.1 hypothetical protein FCI23_45055 [Actinacidiphila oryziradicis]
MVSAVLVPLVLLVLVLAPGWHEEWKTSRLPLPAPVASRGRLSRAAVSLLMRAASACGLTRG